MPCTAPQGHSYAANPVLRQMHEFVDSLAALWPNLQGGAAKGSSTYPPATSDAGPLAEVSPRAAVKPGERATISMTLRNSESQPVRLVPTATDLLGSRGGRIPNSLLEFTPSEIALEPQEQKALAISTTVPVDAAPGCYSGLLVVRGLDYLRALITIEVASTTATPASVQTLSPPSTALSPRLTPSSMSSARCRVSTARCPIRIGAAMGCRSPGSSGLGRYLRLGYNSVMQEAIKLAEDGELGNSDAIRLLADSAPPGGHQGGALQVRTGTDPRSEEQADLGGVCAAAGGCRQSAVGADLRQVSDHRQDLHDRERHGRAERSPVLQRGDGAALR